MPRLILVILLLASTAHADRVVLVDGDMELLHAVESSLAPWHMTIIVDARPVDESSAAQRADVAGARFLVWREGKELVVYDRTTNTADRRPARAGAFDNVSAAAAALTVKTLMRLPPPEETPPPPPPGDGDVVASAPAAARSGLSVRIEAGGAGRVGPGSGVGFGGRLVLGAMIRPSTTYGWRFGVRGDLGTSTSISKSGTTGTWNDWSVLAAASYTFAWGPWELEPWVGAGVTRGVLDVVEASTPRTEREAMFDARVGAIGRRRFGSLTVGPAIDLSLTPAAPVYTRETMGVGMPALFEAAKFLVVFGIVVAVDLGG